MNLKPGAWVGVLVVGTRISGVLHAHIQLRVYTVVIRLSERDKMKRETIDNIGLTVV